jgi:hypothetical protein
MSSFSPNRETAQRYRLTPGLRVFDLGAPFGVCGQRLEAWIGLAQDLLLAFEEKVFAAADVEPLPDLADVDPKGAVHPHVPAAITCGAAA